jgi:hypothetical protein
MASQMPIQFRSNVTSTAIKPIGVKPKRKVTMLLLCVAKRACERNQAEKTTVDLG